MTMTSLLDELRKHRILRLSGKVTTDTADALISQLLLLDADDGQAPIDLYINSHGGYLSDGLAIIDAMQLVQAPVSTICVGTAASMAAVILAAGAKGRRLLTPNSEVMIHQMSGAHKGPESDLAIYAEHLMDQQKRLEALLAGFSGKTKEQVHRDMDRDRFMTAEETLAYGLVDEILKPGMKRPA
jgi:ATP-dependent Clp protease protease subunit